MILQAHSSLLRGLLGERVHWGAVGGQASRWVDGRALFCASSILCEFYFARALFCASSIRLPVHAPCRFLFFVFFIYNFYLPYASNNNELALNNDEIQI